MKVAIVGKGTSAIITALHLVAEGHSPTIFYDPDIPHLKVGESTTVGIGKLINKVLKINTAELCERGICSLKTGVKFIDWGVGKEFYSNFEYHIAFQFDTIKFNAFINEELEKRKLVEYIPERVDSHEVINNQYIVVNDRQFNFIIYCTGWSEEDEYYPVYLNTVNSAVLYTQNSLDVDSTYTIHRATEDGWQFGLPFPKENKTKCGYLYDKNLITKEKVIKKLDGYEITGQIDWTPKYSKKLIINKFCAYNGNRLFFHEPLQALTLHYYDYAAELITDYLRRGNVTSYIECNQKYQKEFWTYQLTLAMHYRFGSIHDTMYWNRVKKDSNVLLESHSLGREEIYEKSIMTDYFHNTNYSKIGIFEHIGGRDIYYGLSGKNFDECKQKYINEWECFR